MENEQAPKPSATLPDSHSDAPARGAAFENLGLETAGPVAVAGMNARAQSLAWGLGIGGIAAAVGIVYVGAVVFERLFPYLQWLFLMAVM